MEDATETDDESLVGEIAHIVGEEVAGPRGRSPLSRDQRNKFANLILLCNVHHKQVDDQVNHFTVDRLHQIKKEHLHWVKTALSNFDPNRQSEAEMWAGCIDEWASRADLDHWTENTYGLLQPNPCIDRQFLAVLSELPTWTQSRIWPENSRALKEALHAFGIVTLDLVNRFGEHAMTESKQDLIKTEKFYKIREWDAELYERLGRRYDFHVDLIHDLTFEMTRAANYVCDKVREHLDKSYRRKEGALLVRRGLSEDLMEHVYRPEYRDKERVPRPYVSLKEYLRVRRTRDYCVGDGDEPN